MSKTSMHKYKWEKYLPIRRTKLRSYLVGGGVLLGLAGFNTMAALPFSVGAVFMALAAWLHVWAKGHLDKNATLTRSGPYRWVRDPFHLSNFFMDLGLCLIINNGVFTLVMMTFWVIAYRHRLWEEDQQLVEIFGDEYLDYRARIPRMIPYRPPMEKKYDKPFSVRHAPIYRGSVCTRLFRLASYPYLFFVAAEIGQKGTDLLAAQEHPAFYWALTGFLFFHFLSRAAGEITKRRASILPLWTLRHPARGVIVSIMVAALLAVDMLWSGPRILEWHLDRGQWLILLVAAMLLVATLRGLWHSVRFRRLIEGTALVVAWLFTPVPWLALVPACYFSAAFLYGDPDQPEADVDHVFLATKTDGAALAALGLWMPLILIGLPATWF
ncbi:methyltransferase family protein [Alloalcanivorax xenomutans]|uniref:methyltransferase family protein n=1 Tax=Alloalcanivorax xenomutans TaxID=1094342 RepID=UPI0004AE759D|nr:hypothetical protein A3Q32_16305 [Alcanivorax sp. KX64203]